MPNLVLIVRDKDFCFIFFSITYSEHLLCLRIYVSSQSVVVFLNWAMKSIQYVKTRV